MSAGALRHSASAPVYRQSRTATAGGLLSVHGSMGSGSNAIQVVHGVTLRQRIPSTAPRTTFREWHVHSLTE
eukprot:4797972-Prymnesium_polylepis.1